MKLRGPILLICLHWLCCANAQKLTVEPYSAGEGITVQSGHKYSIRFSGFIQPMVESRAYPTLDAQTTYQRFRMRRLVTKLTGEAKKENISYQLQVDLTGSSDGGGDGTTNNYLMDAWVSWKPSRSFELVLGQENAPTDSREMVVLSNALQLPDRSPVALAFSSIREFGAFVNTRVKIGREAIFMPSFAITNGDGPNVFTKDHGGLKVGGRVDFLPFGTFSNAGQSRQADMEREPIPKLVLGITASRNYGISDRRGRQSGTILYQDSLGNETLPDYTKIGADFMLKYRGFSMYGEYIKATASVPSTIYQRVRTDGSTSPAFLVNGMQDITSYVKGRLMVGSGFNIQGGYLFTNGYSVDGRFSRLIPETNSFLRNGTFYNRSNTYTLCLSKYMGRNYGAKVQAAVTLTKVEPGSNTVMGEPLIGNEVSGIIMFTFAL